LGHPENKNVVGRSILLCPTQENHSIWYELIASQEINKLAGAFAIVAILAK
jgi:hypothetical protein